MVGKNVKERDWHVGAQLIWWDSALLAFSTFILFHSFPLSHPPHTLFPTSLSRVRTASLPSVRDGSGGFQFS